MSILDKISGRVKTSGDLADDRFPKRQGAVEERNGDAQEQSSDAQDGSGPDHQQRPREEQQHSR
jgi:uncharacterized protein YjbJ (UPF0337 family)